LLKSLSNQLGGLVKKWVMELAAKVVPNIKFTLPSWGVHTDLSAQLDPVCANGRININWKVGWTGFSVDTTQIDNANAQTPSLSSFSQNLANEVAQSCQSALNQFNNVFHTCECKLLKVALDLISGMFSCFPGDATVVTPQGKKAMSQLKVGDCVLSKRADGTEEPCDEVYMFGHAEHGEQHLYYQLVLTSGATLSLSNKHFIHTAQSPTTLFNQAERKYAQDVSVGEWIWEANGKMSQVTAVERKLHSGAFNPYTKSGNIIVDGVVASSHSNWFLDELVPRSATKHLPDIYQAVLVVNRVLHALFGPAAAEALGLANTGTPTAGNWWISYWPAVAAATAICATIVPIGAKRLLKL